MTEVAEYLEIKPDLMNWLDEKDVIQDMHQTLMDIAYDNLKQHEDPDRPGTYNVSGWRMNRPWSHALLTGLAEESFGNLVQFAVLIGKYNQQVTNGGHHQYWNNHYASDRDITEDITLHAILEHLFDEFRYDVEKVLNLTEEDKHVLYEVRECLRSFRDQLELQGKRKPPYLIADEDGDIYDSDYDEDNYEAGQPTDWCREHWNMIDSRYYKVNEKLMNLLEEYFEEKIKLYKS